MCERVCGSSDKPYLLATNVLVSLYGLFKTERQAEWQSKCARNRLNMFRFDRERRYIFIAPQIVSPNRQTQWAADLAPRHIHLLRLWLYLERVVSLCLLLFFLITWLFLYSSTWVIASEKTTFKYSEGKEERGEIVPHRGTTVLGCSLIGLSHEDSELHQSTRDVGDIHCHVRVGPRYPLLMFLPGVCVAVQLLKGCRGYIVLSSQV